MKQLTIIKVGGAILEQKDKLKILLRIFHQCKGAKILIHGGGKEVSRLSRQLGIPVRMQDGRRITDADTLKVATMVYAGWVNKTVVSQLQSLGTNAVGFSGADGNLIVADKRGVADVDFGFAGDVSEVNQKLLKQILSLKWVPVLCAITHDASGQLLNTNADTIAAKIATALCRDYAITLKYVFEKEGVLKDVNDTSSLINMISKSDVDRLQQEGIIQDGMIPKLQNAFDALKEGVQQVSICGIDGIYQNTGTDIVI